MCNHLSNLLFVVVDLYLIKASLLFNNTLKMHLMLSENPVLLFLGFVMCILLYHSLITAFIVSGVLENVIYIVRLLFEPTYWRLEFCCISEMVS